MCGRDAPPYSSSDSAEKKSIINLSCDFTWYLPSSYAGNVYPKHMIIMIFSFMAPPISHNFCGFVCDSYLQTSGFLLQSALLKLGLINDAVEFGHLVLQLLHSPPQPLDLLREPSCLALCHPLCRFDLWLLFRHCCTTLYRERWSERGLLITSQYIYEGGRFKHWFYPHHTEKKPPRLSLSTWDPAWSDAGLHKSTVARSRSRRFKWVVQSR